jgi:nicotinate-nucleotide adenylyltransferase
VRVGLLGGTFNPVHWGHLRAAEEIREMFNLKQVIFIPTNISPHKESKEIVTADHRLKMLDLAIEDNPYFFTSDVELKRSGKSYSIETISHFKQKFGEELTLFFILGIDAFLEITSWKNYQALFSICNFIVMSRPRYEIKEFYQVIPAQVKKDFHYHPNEKRFIHSSQVSIYFTEITPIDISSNSIRTLIKDGRSIKYLLPEEVENYVKEHKFYRA